MMLQSQLVVVKCNVLQIDFGKINIIKIVK